MTKIKETKKHRRDKVRKNIASGMPFVLLGSLAAFFLYLYVTVFSSLSLREEGILGVLNHNNIFKYFVGLAVLALAVFVLRALTRWLPHRASEKLFASELPRGVGIGFVALYLLAIGAFLLYYLFHTELSGGVYGASPENLMWHHLPLVLIVVFVSAVAIWMLSLAYRDQKSTQVGAYVAYALAILITYLSFLFINMKDFHHGIAYTESIYNVWCGAPYNMVTTGIYGHYGIFFGLLLKVFGGNSIALAHMIAFSGALSTAACAYIIHHLTAKNYLRIPTILACVMSIAVLRYKNYWQLQPHRVLFPLLIIAFVVYLVKKGSFGKGRIALGYLLCTAAIVWNTESGLFCTLTYSLALIVYFWQTEAWYAKKMWLRYAALIGASAASLVGAILFVNLYQLATHGSFIFKEFFFPLGVDDYMNDSLKLDMPGGVQVWYLVLFLFVSLLLFGLYHTKFFRRDAKLTKKSDRLDASAPIFVAIAVVSLLNFSYFANRGAYFNLDICSQSACLAMLVFADRFSDNARRIFKQKLTFSEVSTAALSVVSIVILAAMATQIVFAVDPLSKKYDEGVWDREILEAQTEEFAEIVPEDYMVIGLGASTYLLQLERTAPYCYRDFSDLYVGGTLVADTIVEDALSHGKIAFYLSPIDKDIEALMERILGAGEFTLTAEGSVGDARVLCYEKK